MHHGDRTRHPTVSQIAEEEGELHRREHPLERDRPARQRRKVHADSGPLDLCGRLLGALAQTVDAAVQFESAQRTAVLRSGGDEQVRHVRHAGQCGPADVGADRVHVHVVPAEDLDALLFRYPGHTLPCGNPGLRIGRQEADARREGVGAVGARLRQRERDTFAEELDG